ncbi:unnamed protein product [Camellia sinensis]
MYSFIIASSIIQDIGNACRDWGFFMVINHGVQEKLMDDMVKASKSFFDMSEEEKGEYNGKQLFDPIRSGTSFNVLVDKSLFWRDYLKVHVHPHVHSPNKPACFRLLTRFREISQEYCKRARDVASELLKGISMSLGLEENYIDKAMEVEFGSQLLVVNFYPPCPQPELAIGMPPHSDHGLFTLLIQNQLGGLQVLHNGKWVPINPLPNSILVNTGDHMEADMDQVVVIKRVLRCFEVLSKLRINYLKSVVCGVGVVEDSLQNFARCLNCKVHRLPLKFLGLPLGSNPGNKSTWKPVLDTIRVRLSGWKRKMLSFAGRLTLIKSVLSSLPVYYLSLFKMPDGVAREVEKLEAAFLWGGNGLKRKIHLVKWLDVTKSVPQGGLGIRRLRDEGSHHQYLARKTSDTDWNFNFRRPLYAWELPDESRLLSVLILTNGKYKSVVHRAMVNNKANRISIATSHGPPLDKVVSPAQELVDTDFHPIAYHGITYRGYLELQQSNELNGKSCLDRIRV